MHSHLSRVYRAGIGNDIITRLSSECVCVHSRVGRDPASPPEPSSRLTQQDCCHFQHQTSFTLRKRPRMQNRCLWFMTKIPILPVHQLYTLQSLCTVYKRIILHVRELPRISIRQCPNTSASLKIRHTPLVNGLGGVCICLNSGSYAVCCYIGKSKFKSD